jgi:hypothetical protein
MSDMEWPGGEIYLPFWDEETLSWLDGIDHKWDEMSESWVKVKDEDAV